MLFKYLNDDAFLIFSRGNRHLYEACLLQVHERYFETGTHFPTPQEIVHTIYDVLGANPHLLSDEAELQSLPEIVSSRRRRIRFVGVAGDGGDKALRLSTHIYTRLVETGSRYTFLPLVRHRPGRRLDIPHCGKGGGTGDISSYDGA